MLYEIQRELAEALRTRGCPLPVVYGPEPTQKLPSNERIVFQRQGQPEEMGFAQVTKRNPPGTGYKRWQGFAIRVHCQSTKKNARIQDHERRCDHVLDRIVACMVRVVAERGNSLEWTGGGWVRPEDMQAEENERGVFSGVVYELTGRVDRGVFDWETWPDSENPEGGKGDEAVVGTDFDIATELGDVT